MSSGKFFSGLTEGMMRHSDRPDRQKSNFFWPEEEEVESVPETRSKSRRSSVQSPDRNYSQHNEDIPSPSDLHAKQQTSKIEFYDTVDDAKTNRLNNQQFMTPDSNKYDNKQKSLQSNVQFYDYDDGRKNNVSSGVKPKNSNKDADFMNAKFNHDLNEVENKFQNHKFVSEMDNNRYNSSRSDHFDRPMRHEPVKNNFNQKSQMRDGDDNGDYYTSKNTYKSNSSSVNSINKNHRESRSEVDQDVKIKNGKHNSESNQQQINKSNFDNDYHDNITTVTTNYHQVHVESSADGRIENQFDGRRQYESTEIPTKQNFIKTNKTESAIHRPITGNGLELEQQHNSYGEKFNNETERSSTKTHYIHTESNNSSESKSPTHTQPSSSSRHPSYQSSSFYGVVGTPNAVPEARSRAHNNLKSSIFFG